MPHHDEGAALLLAMLTAGLLAALGVSSLVAADVERRAAANAAYANQAFAAAEAAMERAVVDLRGSTDWNAFLSGAAPSTFAATSKRVSLPAGGAIDLDALTAQLQSDTPRQGANTPRWRLFGWGPLAGIGGPGAIDSLQYLIAWLADDTAETDGDPQTDTNGVVVVHAESRGPGGSRRVIDATARRLAGGGVRIESWREIR